MITPTEKLQLISMSNEQMAEGVCKLIEALLEAKDAQYNKDNPEFLRSFQSGTADLNSILLEDSTPLQED